MKAPHTALSAAEQAILDDMAASGELDQGAPALQAASSRTGADKPLAGRRDVSAAQNVRHQAPLFVALDGLELMKLRRFPGWVRWLFLELCASCDFETGELATSYAKLQALMECDQPRQGGQRLPVPSVPQIRRALDDLEDAGMLGRDKAYNTKANGGRGILFLSVGQRKSFGTAKANRDRSCDRVQKAKKPRKHAASSPSAQGVATGVATGVSGALNSITPTPKNRDLSTSTGPKPPQASTPPGPISVGAALGQKLGPPRGADSCPLDAGTPPAATVTARTMRARLKGEKIDPPGGQVDAPQGAPAALPPSARIRRPSNAVLKGDVCDSAGGTTGSEGRGEAAG